MLAMLFPETGVSSWTMIRAIWEPHLWVFVGSLLLALILTPVFRTIAMRMRVYDMPDQRLKTHKEPIPYLGGLAIFLAWAIPVFGIALGLTLAPQQNRLPEATQHLMLVTHVNVHREAPPDEADHPRPPYVPPSERHWVEQPQKLFWILGAALLMLALGLVDDLANLPPKLKIVGQVAAALALAGGGVVFAAFPSSVPESLGGFHLFPAGAWWVVALGLIVQVVLVVGASNATNLLDGLDGLCSGVTAFICLGFLLLATSLLAWDLFHPSGGVHYSYSSIIVILAFALAGAVLGFLPYNFNPASIFMGDAGSMFLGFMAAVFMILFAERSTAFKWFLGSMVIFGLPIFDTGLALVRRLVNHRPIFAGDRSHLYDQLVDRGCSVQKSVVINYALALGFVAAGVAVAYLRTRYSIPVYLAIFAVIGIAAVKMGFVRADRSGGAGDSDDPYRP